MTAQDCTATAAVSKNFNYPSLINSPLLPERVEEDADDYTVTPAAATALSAELERLEVQARRKSIAGQITRLHGIVSVLLPNEQPMDRTGEALRQIAIELEQAATLIEDEVTGMVKLVLENHKADEALAD